MGKKYHPNAKTTIQMRKMIKESKQSVAELARRLGLSPTTVRKWKKREDLEDRSSRPHRVRSALNAIEEWVICEVRRSTGLGLDSLVEVLKPFIPRAERNNVVRCLRRHGILEEERKLKQQGKLPRRLGKFEECEPGFVHVDVKYLPKLPGEKQRKMLFVAIDRATRFVYMSIKDKKDADSATEFLEGLVKAFPFKIYKVLTDNGKEFTDRFRRQICGKPTGKHPFDRLCKQLGIEHRLTQPYSPQTNGLVERFNGRITEILRKNHFYTYKQLKETLEKYLICYNYRNKQRVLNNRSPSEMVLEWYHKNPLLFKDDFDASQHNLLIPDSYITSFHYFLIRKL